MWTPFFWECFPVWLLVPDSRVVLRYWFMMIILIIDF